MKRTPHFFLSFRGAILCFCKGREHGILSRLKIPAFAGMTIVMMGMSPVLAQAPVKLDSGKPIEIEANALEVLQEKHMAIFSGDVEALQGNISIKSQRMRVYYREAGSQSSTGLGAVSRIEVEDKVMLSTPEESAKANKGVYDVDKQMITLLGDVILARGKNMLRGGRLDYNLKTQKSLLTSGTAETTPDGAVKTSGGRVKGVFVPKQ